MSHPKLKYSTVNIKNTGKKKCNTVKKTALLRFPGVFNNQSVRTQSLYLKYESLLMCCRVTSQLPKRADLYMCLLT